MKKNPLLSLVIPAYNEEWCIQDTVMKFHQKLQHNSIPHEILVINDNSKDSTEKILQKLSTKYLEVRYINNTPPHGFGRAVRKWLENFSGDYVAIVMADLSDNPDDLVVMYNKAIEWYDCVFGSRRWITWRKAKVVDYPMHKKILNRLTNNIIRLLFGIKYNDTTNAFKMYSKQTIDGLKPFLSNHFNLTVELPLKAIIRKYSYTVVKTDWINRKTWVSNLKIKEMWSRYFFVILYCLLEKWLSMGDYRKKINKWE